VLVQLCFQPISSINLLTPNGLFELPELLTTVTLSLLPALINLARGAQLFEYKSLALNHPAAGHFVCCSLRGLAALFLNASYESLKDSL